MSLLGARLGKQINPEYTGPQKFEPPHPSGLKPVHSRTTDAFDKICDAFFGFFERMPARVKSAVSQLIRALGGEATSKVTKHIKENANESEPSAAGEAGGGKIPSSSSAQPTRVTLSVATATEEFMKIAYPQKAAEIKKGPVKLDAEKPNYAKAGQALAKVFVSGSNEGDFAAAVNNAVEARTTKKVPGDSKDSIARRIFDEFPQPLKEALADSHKPLRLYLNNKEDVPKNFAQCLVAAGEFLELRALAGKI